MVPSLSSLGLAIGPFFQQLIEEHLKKFLFSFVLAAILSIFQQLLKEYFKKYFTGYVISPCAQHIGYAFTCDSKVDTLQKQVGKLKDKRLRLQQSVEAATRKGEEMYADVTEWLAAAEKDIEDAEKLIRGKAEAMKKCFVGICPNLKTRCQLGKKAHKKALAVGKRLQDAQAASDPISFRPPLQQIVEPSVYRSEALPSRVLILDQIMDALKDPKLNIIGVYGMGGVGKTTLANEVKGRAIQEKMLFETVVSVAVSQTPDLRRIQGEIADSLGLKFDAEEVPGRASRLHQRLEKAKVLLILDDVWQYLDLKAVGVPSEGCKILVTSRRKEVLCNEMHTQKDFSLGVLKEEETWRLFEMSASNITNPELHGIATEIAKKCAGLPLLILKVAADLRGKESYAWSDMLNRLSSLEDTDIYEKVHRVIESSYENLLDVEAKSAFLLCALFGDSNIEIHKLLMYSVGLGLFKHIDSIEGLRNRVLTLIDKLKDECLLLDGDRAGFVKLHDVVREVALVITSKVQHVFVGSGKVRFGDFQNKDRTRFSLPYCDISELPEVLKCPEAEVFSMIANHDRLDIPCSFFEGSPKLKVVDFTGVCFVSGLPSSLGCLVGLQALCLHRCELHNVAIVSELKQLEVLSFAESNIEELPEEIKGLTRLKLLDLRYCYNLKVIPANVLTNLSLLEELYIFNNGFHGWEAEGNASLVELKNLSHLTTLEICVRGDKLLPKDWFFDGVQNYRISIGEGSWIEDKIEPLRSRRILKLELKASIGLMNRIKAFVRSTEVLDLHDVKGVENLLCDFGKEKTDCGQLQILKIFHCDTLKSLCLHSFPQLQQLEVSSCRKMEAISGEGFRDEVIEFTQLNSLKLNNLPNLVSFCKTSGMISFPNLTRLVVSNCMSLKYIFTTLMVKSLKRLKELEINYCKLMEEIVLSEKVEEIEEEEEDESINRIVFPELDCLKLGNLENLKRFSSGYPVDFPSLRVLEMNKCRAIDKLVSKFMNRNNSNESFDEYLFNESVAFFNIEELSLDGMDRFKYIFPALIACGLPQLRKLEIYKCGVEAIIANAKDETTEIKLPKLSHLSLSECHNMIIISANNSKVSFPSLTRLEIYECKGLKYVFTKSMVKSLERLKELEISRCESMEEIILSEETEEENINKIVFPELDCLRLINLQKLKRFSRGNPIDFSSLRILNIYECRAVEKWVSKLTNGSNSNENVEEYLFDEMVTFSNLEKLLIGGINKLKYVWNEDIDSEAFNVKNLQFINVSRCPDLKYVFPASIACGIPQLRRLRIYGCGVEVIIANAKDETIEWPFLTKLEVSQCYNLISISANNSKVTFPSLEHLSIAGMDKLKYLVPASVARSLLQLRKLEINKCGVEVIIANDKEEKIEIEWPNLTHLKVLDCQKLIKFGSNNFKLLPNVEVLELDHRSFTAIQSDELPVDFSLQLKRVTLNSLSLQRKNINRLFLSLDDEKEIGDHEKKYHLTLEHLELRYVSNLKHILKKDSLISPVLQHLQSLAVLACDDLMNIAPSSASFQYLTTLKVEGCKKTTSLVTASTAKTMAQLVKLTVSDCKMMEEIIAKDGNAGFTKHDVIVFEKLKYLELISLGRLDSFCSGNYNFNFPLLEKATVKNCSRMKIFCSGIVSSPKLEGIKIKRMGLTGMTYITQLNAVLQRIKQASCERL